MPNLTSRAAALIAAALLACAPAAAAPPVSSCVMDAADRAWMEEALTAWRHAEAAYLRLSPSPLPLVIAVDQSCTFTGRGNGAQIEWSGVEHAGMVELPHGRRIPVGVMSFAAPAEGNQGAFFVMSLPSLWRAAGVRSSLKLETFLTGVLLHEMMHTRQFYFVGPRLDALIRRYALPSNIDDDSLQAAFSGNHDYVRAYERERDLFYAAAAAANDAEARLLAREALGAMRVRRARWFTGADEKWAPVEETFLTMEGLGQWAAFKWYLDAEAIGPEQAVEAVRRNRGSWSQDEGFAIFLVIDRLVDGWQARAFGSSPETVDALLERAIR